MWGLLICTSDDGVDLAIPSESIQRIMRVPADTLKHNGISAKESEINVVLMETELELYVFTTHSPNNVFIELYTAWEKARKERFSGHKS